MRFPLAAWPVWAVTILFLVPAAALAATSNSLIAHADSPGAVKLAGGGTAADIYVDEHDSKLVNIAAGLFSDDMQRMTGIKPIVRHDAAAVIIGAIGNSALVDKLIADGKIDVKDVAGQWETYKIQVVQHPTPGIDAAVVIVGSDRRGTAFGVFDLSQAIGVSPWYWWADASPVHQDALYVKAGGIKQGPPSVKYRGIFINDEDWGLEPWAAKTFDPDQGNIGPKTYEKVFELILRLRGNFLWPAMHPISNDFGRIPRNITLADDWGIVMGASHTEAMNRNNVLWPKEGVGPWRYDTNRDNVLAYWEEWAKNRGPYEAVWTLGIRGVHDAAMLGPPDPDAKVKIVEDAIHDQRQLLKKYVNPDLSKVPQLFAPYKEVLALYQRGMKVPEDVTLLWTDDNFGYIRQLSTPDEQKRSGGAGIYYHISYLGGPRSYVWLNTTPPALIGEEMTKAYDYGANRVWVLNVGDIKPGEIGMEFWLRLAWDIQSYNRQTVPDYLLDFASREFGAVQGPAIAQTMAEYYRLGFDRKPEAMDSYSFTSDEATRRLADYAAIDRQAQAINERLPQAKRDEFYELVLYPVKICDLVNQVFLQNDADALRKISTETDYYNNTLAGGKWRFMMSEKGTSSKTWGFKWPGEAGPPPAKPRAVGTGPYWAVDADHYSRSVPRGAARWHMITGLGRTANCMAVYPTTTPSIAEPSQIQTQAPELDYDLAMTSGPVTVTVYALPTHRINAQRGLRYAVAIDDEPPQVVSFEQSAGDNNNAWGVNVLRNAAITSTAHTLGGDGGKHTLKIFMVDPGVLLEKIVVSVGDPPATYLGPQETANP